MGDDSSVESLPSIASQSQSSSVSVRGLSLTLKRQLLRDVEEAGGIDTVLAKDLLLAKPDIYGHPDSEFGQTQRKKVQNCIRWWKDKNKKGEFETIRQTLNRRLSLLSASSPPNEVAVSEIARSPVVASPPPRARAQVVPPSPRITMDKYAGKLKLLELKLVRALRLNLTSLSFLQSSSRSTTPRSTRLSFSLFSRFSVFWMTKTLPISIIMGMRLS
jgi:hypothetical protein